MQKKYKNTYQKLNQDLSKSKYSPEVYFDAQNIRILSHQRQSTGSVNTIKGNEYKLNIPVISFIGIGPNNQYLYRYVVNNSIKTFATNKTFSWINFESMPHGYAIIRNKIMFFSTDENGEPNGSTGAHWLYDVDTNDIELIYLGVMNYSTKYPIDAFGNYENSNVQKVYWLDGFNLFRHMNIVDPNLSTLPETNLSTNPEYDFETISLDSIIYSSGNFKSGKVAYTYSYANQYGAETKIAPITQYFPVAQKNSGLLNEENAAVAFRLKIDNPDTRFDYVRLYRIFLSLPNAVPVVTLIKEEPIGSSTIYMVDDGTEEIAAVSIEQLLAIGAQPKIPYTFDIKDNRIFTANHKTSFFDVDFDFRAYRFNTLQNCSIWDSNGNIQTVDNVPSGQLNSWFDVDKKHDAINYSNTAETDNNASAAAKAELDLEPNDVFYNQYIYQSDGATIGAEGPYVKIGLKVTTMPIEDYTNYVYYPSYNESFLNPIKMDLIGLKRDEVYRIGIECYNALGQTSFVNWVCDFKMPSPADLPLVTSDGLKLNQVQLTFELKQVAIALLRMKGVVGYRVLRVERTPENRSIQCQGMIAPILRDAQSYALPAYRMPPYMGFVGDFVTNSPNLETQYAYSISSDKVAIIEYDAGSSPEDNQVFYSNSVVEFRSPDLNQSVIPSGYFILHSAVQFQAYARYLVSGLTNPSDSVNLFWREDSNNYALDSSFRMLRSANGFVTNKPVHLKAHGNILNFDRLDQASGVLNNGSFSASIVNRFAYGTSAGKGINSVCNDAIVTAICSDGGGYELRDQLGQEIMDFSTYYGFILADFKRRLPNQYGGFTYADRTRNIYIPSSDYQKLSTNPVTIYGDTYTNMMRYQRSQVNPDFGLTAWAANEGSNLRDLYFLPCETTVNEDLRVRDYINFSSSNSDKYFTTIDEFHQYNEVYHEQMNEKVNSSKPLDFQFSDVFDNEFGYSDLKVPGEFYDSWIKFQPGNINYVDGIYGPVERIIINGDKLFFFQHYAYGVWSVNPNVTVNGEQGMSVEIGTGGVLHDFQYISTNLGTQNKLSVSSSQFGLIWYDNLKRKLISLGSNLEELNLKGINTWLQNNYNFGNNPIQRNGVYSVFNTRTNETYITFLGDTNTTWVYSHISGFVCKLTSWPNFWIKSPNNLFSFEFDLNQPHNVKLFEFDKGSQGKFNDKVYPSYITIIVNGDPDFVKLLTNLQWNSEAYDKDGNEQSLKTITHIRIWNDYMDSGLVPLNSKNSSRYLRDWRYTVPVLQGRIRFRSQYHFVQLYSDNFENLELVIHDLVSSVILQY